MLKIRFLRRGKRNQPFFFIVVVEKNRPPQSGRFVEKIGFYNPITKERKIDRERVRYWLNNGAQPSDVVFNLLIKEGVIKGKKISVHKRPKKEKADGQGENSTQEKKASTSEVKEEKKEEKKEEIKEETSEEIRESEKENMSDQGEETKKEISKEREESIQNKGGGQEMKQEDKKDDFQKEGGQ